MSHCNESLSELLSDVGVVPVVTIADVDHAVPLANALLDGGINVIEVTMRTPDALAAVKSIRQQVPRMIVGVGTVNTADKFKAAYEVDASFAVSPGVTDKLLLAADEISLPYLPGVATPSEAMQLYDHGYRYLKLFPAEAVGGCGLLKSMLAPLPDITFCPTGGISLEKATEYLQLSNVICVGGSWLAPSDYLRQNNWQAITDLARQAAELCKRSS